MEKLRLRKERLMARLNIGIFEPAEWCEFITDARKAGCEAMAGDMEKRMKHYMVAWS